MKLFPAPYGALVIASKCYKVGLAPYSARKEFTSRVYAEMKSLRKDRLVSKAKKAKT